ncbi:MAG: ABC transporter ATP-binding protein [Acidobacteriota bacterium]|nr:ABC transporter ATP-binding protein [Acidobacteriota bacterium]
MSRLLDVVDLHVWYRASSGETAVLSGVNLALDTGEIVGIRGPSGAGKSTLGFAILNALPANARRAGLIRFAGSAIAPVFQEASGALHPMLTAGAQVTEALRARKPDLNRVRCRAAVEAALDSVGLNPAEFFHAWPHELSGGQRQRVLMAQAIAGGPDVIVADEPVASLDSVAQRSLSRLLCELCSRARLSLVLISHSRDLLARAASRVLMMRGGVLVCDDD